MSTFLGMMIGIVFGILIGTIPDGESVQLKIESEGLKEKYYELILAVATKCPKETRHETALRYIFEAEKGSIEAMKNG